MTRLNMLDVAKATDPDGKAAQVVEVLSESNPIIEDAPTYASNASLGHRVTLRSSLPTVDFTKLNKGSTRSKSTFVQRVDTIGILDGRSEVDVRMKIGMGDAKFAAHRKQQDDGFVEAMSQTGALNLFYGDERTNEAAFTGVQPRLNTLGTAASGSKVLSAASSDTDNTSIYVIDWHERYSHLIHPEGTTVGIDVRTLGEQSVNDADGNPFQAFVTAINWALGFTNKDPRHLGRLANIEVSAIATAGASGYAGPDLVNLLTDLLSEMPDPGGAQRVLYCHNKVWAAFHKLALAKAAGAVTVQEYLGKPQPHFWNYPMRRCDKISLTEAVVS